MTDLIRFDALPSAETPMLIVGWRQWADAGSVSSGLPDYLIEQLDARKIGEMPDNGYYLFQVPGAHHLLRPQIRLEDGYRQELEMPRNEFFYAEEHGIVIFLGDEPHLNVQRYAEAFFSAVDTLNVQRVVGLGGVYAPVPYEPDRQISAIYSLPDMKQELEAFALEFSNYEGGSSIGTYLVSEAEARLVRYVSFYAIVPAYDFPAEDDLPQGVRIEHDYKAWYDIMRRINQWLETVVDLTHLQRLAGELLDRMDSQLNELEETYPQMGLRAFLTQVTEMFEERPFMPLDDVWAQEFDQLFGDEDEG